MLVNNSVFALLVNSNYHLRLFVYSNSRFCYLISLLTFAWPLAFCVFRILHIFRAFSCMTVFCLFSAPSLYVTIVNIFCALFSLSVFFVLP